MICRCPNCNGALKFNPAHEKMACPYCGGIYAVSEFVKEEIIEGTDAPIQEPEADNRETMSCNIYTCTACGGELAVNGVEASTFCPYCGQPTIVFDRVSHELKPKGVLPFKVTKEQAVNSVRERFGKSYFVVEEVKKFDVEKIRGIYIPYWLYDIHYHDTQTYAGEKADANGESKEMIFLREAECDFTGISVDASFALDNAITKMLEPFDFKELQPFQPEYLSGFYADMYDVTGDSLVEDAMERAATLFGIEIEKSIKKDGGSHLVKKTVSPETEIKKAEYTLLPVWFLTFRYKDEPHTILVNGQTGKIVGLAPFDKKKFWRTYLACTLGFGIVLGILFVMLSLLLPGLTFLLFAILGFVALFAGAVGGLVYYFLNCSFKERKAEVMAKFVKERQEES